MKVWIDGDACPDIADILKLCHKYQVQVSIVCDDSHEFPNYDEVIVVSTGFQNTDMYLLNHIQNNDFVITADYGIAVIALAKRCVVLHPDGYFYTNENISQLLFQRHIHGKMRRNKMKTPYNKKRTEKVKNDFLLQIETILKKHHNVS